MALIPKKQPALGRGLGALLANNETDITSASGIPLGSISLIPISSIEANPFNPRSHFEKEAMEELASSIKIHGIIQPLTVRKLGRDKYQLISGERRFRASQLAGFQEVPAYIRVANDQNMLEMALVENIQRENLNAIEVGLSYQRLIEECKLTQEQLGSKIAKSRSDIANHLRLLKLPVEIQAGVRDGKISMGHARALLSIEKSEDQLKAFHQILTDSLSVRETEQLSKKKPKSNFSIPISNGTTFSHIEAKLEKIVGSSVKIQVSSKGNGKLILHFKNTEALEKIVSRIKK